MIGILLVIVSSVLTGIAFFVQRNVLGGSRLRKAIFDKKWIAASLLMLFAFILYTISLNFERLTIIQPLTNISILILVLLELTVLKEKISRREIVAVILFFIGIMMVSI